MYILIKEIERSSGHEISSVQLDQIKCMVACADYIESLLSELPDDCHAASFFRGYISAVSSFMEILDIDENRVEQ